MPRSDLAFARPLIGLVPLLLTLSCGGGDGGSTTPTPNPTPTISALGRDTATAGTTPFSVVLHGSDFRSGVVVSFDGNARTTTPTNGSTISFLLQASDLASVGDHEIRAKNPEPGGGPSAAILFHVLAAPPTPALDSIAPDTATIHGASRALEAYGSDFVAQSRIRWNGFDLTTTHVSGSHLSATVTAAMLGLTDTVAVTVFTPGPGGGTSAAKSFEIDERLPPPIITAASPGPLRAGNDTIQLTLNGVRFLGADTVTFTQGGTTRRVTPTAVTDSSLQVALDRSFLAARVYLSIKVHAGWGTSSAFDILVEHQAIVVTALTPDTLDAAKTSDTLYLTGAHFTSDSWVYFGSDELPTTFVDSTHLTAVAPQNILLRRAGVSEARVLDLWDPANMDSTSVIIRSPIPVLDSVSPLVDSVGTPGHTVYLFGHGLSERGMANVNGAARAVDVGSSGGGVMAIPLQDIDLATPDTLMITFENPAPSGGPSNAVSLVIRPAIAVPDLDSADVDHVVEGQDRSFTLIGNGFLPGAIVEYDPNQYFYGGTTAPATVTDSQHLTVIIPSAGLTGGQYLYLRVRNPSPTSGWSPSIQRPVWSSGVRQVTSVVTGGISQIVADDQRGLVYITQGATVRALDPSDGHQVNSLALPVTVQRLVMSADSSSLWAATSFGGPSAYRIDLASWSVTDSVTPPTGVAGGKDLVALPGGGLAVQYYSPAGWVIGIFDGKVQRPVIDSVGYPMVLVGMIGSDTLVAATYGGWWYLVHLLVDSSGVHELSRSEYVPSNPTYPPGMFGHGVLMGTRLIDAVTGTVIVYKPWGATLGAPDPAQSRLIVVTRSPYGDDATKVFGLDPATGSESASDTLPLPGAIGPIARFGTDGVAFLSDTVHLIFLRAASIEH